MPSPTRAVISRRHTLHGGLVLGGLLAGNALLTDGGGRSPASAAQAGAHPAVARAAAEKFTRPLPILPTQKPYRSTADTDYYRCVVGASTAEILTGVSTPVLTYDGGFPGSVIRARQGRRVVMAQHNDTDVMASVHLHGGKTPERHDAGTMGVMIPAGGRRTYVYENDQPASTMWLHDHAHHVSAQNVFAGMARPYLLTSPEEEALGLPSGEYDVPLMLRDARFDEAGALHYVMDDAEGRSTILVNGAPWPVMKVKARKYRFRIINGANMRFFVLGLSDETPFTQVGGDGGFLPASWQAPVAVVSPGERSDVVVDFSGHAPGTRVVLNNYIGPGPTEDVGVVMAFEVGDPAEDTSTVPASLTTLPALPEPSVRRRFELAMDEPGSGGMSATINGLAYDHDRIDTTVAFGSTEEWTIVNTNATLPHNFHTHLVSFRVLTRDGAPVGLDESGLKDTVQVFPGQEVVIRLTFDSHRGVYPYHCHMIDHSEMGMMAQMKVV